MVKTLATQLFLILAVSANLNLEQVLGAYKPYQSKVLSPLADLSLTDQEAFDKVSSRISRLLGIPLEEGASWFKFVAKETAYAPATVTSDDFQAVHEQASQTLQGVIPHLLEVKKGFETEIFDRKDVLAQAATETLIAKAGELKSLLHEFIKARLRSDFKGFVADPATKMEMVSDTAGFLPLKELLLKTAEDVHNHPDLDLEIDPKFVEGLVDGLRKSLDEIAKFTYELTEVLVLFKNGADMVRVEAESMFFAIQFYAGIPAERRLSRMDAILQILVYLAKQDGKVDFFQSFFTLLRGYYNGAINFSYLGQQVDDTPFQDDTFHPLFRVVVRNFLTFINDQFDPRVSYAHAASLLRSRQTVTTAHYEPFLLSYKEVYGLPVVPAEHSEAHRPQYIKIITFLTVLSFDNVSSNWWLGALKAVDSLLTIDGNTLRVLAYFGLQMDLKITPFNEKTAEFLDVHFGAMLAFLSAEGPKVAEIKNSYPLFDKFLDVHCAAVPAANPFYLRSKVQNIFASNDKIPFDFVFEKIFTEEEAKLMNLPLDQSSFPRLSTNLWNAYVKEEGAKKQASLANQDPVPYKSKATTTGRAALRHIHRPTLGSMNTVHFDHLKVHIVTKALEPAVINTPIAHTVTAVFEVKDEASSLTLVKKPPTENKITLDAGLPETKTETKAETKVEAKSEAEQEAHKEEMEQLATKLSRQNSVIPVQEIQDMIGDQIQATQKSAEVQQKIIEALNLVDQEEEKTEEDSSVAEDKSEGPKDLETPESVEEKKGLEQPQQDLVDIDEELAGVEDLPKLERHPKVYPDYSQDEAKVHPANNFLTPKEKALLEQLDLEAALKELNELVDDENQVTTFVMVKLIPKKSDCFESLFA